jgi:ADP-heptose:LPS heptosyltransferase
VQILGEPDGRPELVALRALKLGDLLVAVPAITGVRRANPDHRLILAVPGWLEPVVDLVPGVDALVPTPGLDDLLPLPAGRIDTAVDLHGGPDSRRVLEALAPRRRVGHRAPGWDGPEWEDGVLERYRWARLVTAHGMPADPDDVAIDRPAVPSPAPGAVVVHVGAFYGCRAWPVERFAAVARTLSDAGHRVVVTGSARERPRALQTAELAGLDDEAVLAGRTGLGELAALVADAALVVSVDTGVPHLASAYATPSVVIFGPGPVEEWGPPRNGPHAVLTHAELRVGDTFGSEPDPALLAVSTDEVLAAAASLLDGRSRG